MNAVYTAVATSLGDGRNGTARTSDGRLEVTLATPTEMGGSGEGTNPEQLFALGYAACFHSAMKGVGGQLGIPVIDSAVTAEVGIGALDDGPGYGLVITLHVELGGGISQADADRLVEAAHRVCPYSNATRGNVEVTLEVETA
ncbi:organic hydroperoxide resistance protein [Pseudolysinimonas sp.]|uniref:organic hydroperoxide resistance protein n=1 Tax=Pseudolysinimonas sp. TaxID=2680009 RepID=UPI003F7EAAC1